MKIPFASMLYFKAIRVEAQMDWFRHSGDWIHLFHHASAKAGHPVFRDIYENRDAAVYWIIRLRR
jgi:hypothetical protein